MADTGLNVSAFALATGALTALLLLACVIGFAMVWRERASLRRLAALHGYRYHGLGEFGGEHAGVSWRCAPHQDDDSGRAWTEFVASGAALDIGTSTPCPCDEVLAAEGRWLEWMDTSAVALWRAAQGKSPSLRLSLARHALSLERDDGRRRATPVETCAIAQLGEACLAAAMAVAHRGQETRISS